MADIKIITGEHKKGSNDFLIALDITLKDGWKTYWRIPGDAGLPPDLNWEGSKNLEGTPEIIWPTPERFELYGIQNTGYPKHVVFPIKITSKVKNKPVLLSLDITLLICEKICVPIQKKLNVTLLPEDIEPSKKIQKVLNGLPQIDKKITMQDIVVITNKNDELPILSMTFLLPEEYKEKDISDIFIYTEEGLYFDAPQIIFSNIKQKRLLEAKIPLRIPLDEDESLKNILEKDPNFFLTLVFKNHRNIKIDLTKLYSITTIDKTSINLISKKTELVSTQSIWAIILLAFIGGLILNIMPCVLPVLSLKFLSVIKSSDKSKQHIRIGFIASALGILTAFWAMAALLSILKASGHAIGWGMQFQSTGFLVALCLILIVFALNLWGIFEIQLPKFIANKLPSNQHHDSLTGNFMTGVLATILATPCSAPFLGTAVGFALSQNTYAIFMIFSFLGLGLAFPYILVAVFPVIAQHMPKPGAWMITVKKIMAIALLLTALWLGSIAGKNIIGRDNITISDNKWEKFSIEKVEKALSRNQTVIVDITADWCITCKANKKLVLNDKEIQTLFIEDNILTLMGDWTQMDNSITKYINSFGRYGIPLNVIYGPNAPNGILLPELLSKAALRTAIKKASE